MALWDGHAQELDALARGVGVLVALAAGVLATARAGATEVSGPITADTTWCVEASPYVIVADVTIQSGATLTLAPGVEVRFRPGTQLVVEDGTLAGIGTAAAMIRLHSDDPLQPGLGVRLRASFGAAGQFAYCEFSNLDQAICLLDGAGGELALANCRLAGNDYGLTGANGRLVAVTTCEFTGNEHAVHQVHSLRAEQCSFQDNQYGVSACTGAELLESQLSGHVVAVAAGDQVFLRGNTITGNGTGVDGFATLSANVVSGNDVGLIVRGAVQQFACNDIAGNAQYNAVMDTSMSLPAGDNWWGSLYADEIAQGIHDGADQPGLGLLIFTPYLRAPHAQAYTCGCATGWTQVPVSGPSPRSGAALAYDTARDVAVLFGGYASGAGAYGDTWEFQADTWTLVAETGPPPRHGHVMAYDVARKEVVLFGGSGIDGYLGDTWTWNGSAWTQVADDGPAARWQSAMAYDSARQVAVLFAGFGIPGGQPTWYGDVWEWDGTGWKRTFDGGYPYIRRMHDLAYDSGRGVTVLFGGHYTDIYFPETREWNGTSWKYIAPPGPPRRTNHAMVFDSARGVTRLFGGAYLGTTLLGDTWEWDGKSWLKVSDSGPSPRDSHAMTYGRGATILFGGPKLGDTWVYNTWPVPVILGQPADLAVTAGQAAVFSVQVQESELPLTFQWRRAGVPLSEGGHLSGTQTPVLTLDPVGLADAGDYDVLVSLTCGGIASDLATLTVTPPYAAGDLNCDGQINAFDIDPFVLALTDEAAYQAAWPNCDALLADVNGDGRIDAFDIDPFVALLVRSAPRP